MALRDGTALLNGSPNRFRPRRRRRSGHRPHPNSLTRPQEPGSSSGVPRSAPRTSVPPEQFKMGPPDLSGSYRAIPLQKGRVPEAMRECLFVGLQDVLARLSASLSAHFRQRVGHRREHGGRSRLAERSQDVQAHYGFAVPSATSTAARNRDTSKPRRLASATPTAKSPPPEWDIWLEGASTHAPYNWSSPALAPTCVNSVPHDQAPN